jgi:hypothetical protein
MFSRKIKDIAVAVGEKGILYFYKINYSAKTLTKLSG